MSRNKSRKRSKKSKKSITLKGKIFIYFFLVLILAVTAIILLLTLPQFNLDKVNINELVKIEEKEILEKANLEIGKNIFLQKYSKAKKEIQNLKAVKSAEIKFKLPNNVNIEVEERIETYQIKSNNEYYIFDDQGYFLKQVAKKIAIPELIGIELKMEDERRLDLSSLILLENVNKIYSTAKLLNIDGLISRITVKTIGYEVEFGTNKKTAHFENTSNLMNSMQFVREIIYSVEEKNKSGDIYTTDEGARFRPR